MNGSIPAPPTGRHLSARDALVAIGLCALLLLAFDGRSIRHSGEEMTPGWERSLVLAVGRPAGVGDAGVAVEIRAVSTRRPRALRYEASRP